jgi:hypothetical protein
MADPCETPELPAPPVEHAKATGASTRTKADAISKLENATAVFKLIDIPETIRTLIF